MLAVATVRGWRPAGLGAIAGLRIAGPHRGWRSVRSSIVSRSICCSSRSAFCCCCSACAGCERRSCARRVSFRCTMKRRLSRPKRQTCASRQTGTRRGSIGLPRSRASRPCFSKDSKWCSSSSRSSAGRGLLLPASAGALAACLLVAGVGFVVHRPLARVPENTLKFAVGVMLAAFGVFWTGEGLGVAWPGADLAIVVFAALFLAVGLAAVALARRPSAEVVAMNTLGCCPSRAARPVRRRRLARSRDCGGRRAGRNFGNSDSRRPIGGGRHLVVRLPRRALRKRGKCCMGLRGLA